MGRLRLVLAVAMLLLVAPAPADAWLALGADGTRAPGRISFFVWGSGSFDRVEVSETVGGRSVPVTSVVPPVVRTGDGIFNGDFYPDRATWRCDRVVREFTAIGYRPDGTTETAQTDLRTPSCRDRFALVVPRARQARGRSVEVVVRDRWALGDVTAQLCVRPPGGTVTCHPAADRTVRLTRRGHYRLALTTPQQTTRAVISSGVAPPADLPSLPRVVSTGDSLMQSVDAVLGDRLGDRASVRSDIQVGSGMSKAQPTDWQRLPQRQARRLKARATVVFLGTNEGWPMRTPGRATVECCGDAYVAEYARRTRRAMRAYLRGGRGAVVWVNVPTARDPRRNVTSRAVNRAIALAARGLPRTAVVDVDAVVAPGGAYRETLPVGGRETRVRAADGVHLTIAGARLVARRVVAELERLRVV